MTANTAPPRIDSLPAAQPRVIGLSFGIFAVLAMIALVPIMTVIVPPLGDFPNHLARMYILHDGGQSRYLAEYYRIEWSILPNLAMDVIVPSLPGYPGGALGHTVLDTHLDWVLAIRQLLEKAGLAGAALVAPSKTRHTHTHTHLEQKRGGGPLLPRRQ